MNAKNELIFLHKPTGSLLKHINYSFLSKHKTEIGLEYINSANKQTFLWLLSRAAFLQRTEQKKKKFKKTGGKKSGILGQVSKHLVVVVTNIKVQLMLLSN